MIVDSIPRNLTAKQWLERLITANDQVGDCFAHLLHNPDLGDAPVCAAQAYEALAATLERGGTLYLCGNGGSLSDALHISGELLKSFRARRPLPPEIKRRLQTQPFGQELGDHLQAGQRAHVLGINPALGSAVSNDIPVSGAAYAQELLALAHPGDALLGISTSGGARNVRMAVSVARAIGMTTIALTGQAPNPLAEQVDIAIGVPGRETYLVQELHIVIYHQLCLMLEARFYA